MHTTATAPKLDAADIDRLRLVGFCPPEAALRVSGDVLWAHPRLVLDGWLIAARFPSDYKLTLTPKARELLAALDAEASEEG
mgnify:FL=1